MSQNVISMHKAKSSLSQLVKLAASGETVLIGSYGRVEAALCTRARYLNGFYVIFVYGIYCGCCKQIAGTGWGMTKGSAYRLG